MTASASSATAGVEVLLAGSQVVEIESAGGRMLAGRIFGDGQVGVVLAHGNRPELGQTGMYELAAALAAAEYRVLTFNFRGFCPSIPNGGCSDGVFVTSALHLDVEAAVAHLRRQGVDTVFVVGSSLGGTAALYAAAQPDIGLAGVVAVSAPQLPGSGVGPPSLTPEVLATIRAPKLFIVGQSDRRYAEDAAAMFAAAAEPKQLETIRGTAAHGEEMLGGFQHTVVERTTELILDFLAEHR